ncbi:MAG: DUF4013 domain-containing protein [Verrucomicrobiota bacterium]
MRLLIGGAFCLSVVGLPLAFGYLFAYAFALKSDPFAPLPPWERWTQMFIVGLHALAVFLAWFGIPFLAALVLSGIFALAPGGVLDIFAWLAIGVAEVFGLCLFVSAMIHYQRIREWRALIEFESIFKPLERHWKKLIVPCLAWLGFMTLGLPLLPFTFFLGITVFLAYAVPLLSRLDAIEMQSNP